jgi:succinate dehydrogenase / fumarate reductase cytochrome b subunit
MGIIGFFKSTIGQKYIVAITGLLFSLFVLSHTLGNFLLFVSPEAYNMYSYKLISNPLIYLAEAGLVVLFVVHLTTAMYLAFKNYAARPDKYAVTAAGDKSTSQIAKMMWVQGAVILAFTVFHLITFKYGPHYLITYDGLEVRDIFRLVVEVFQSPIYVVGYVVVMILLGLHLSHGVQSAFKTLGFNHPQYESKLKMVGYVFSIFITLGFSAQPIYIFLFQ